MPLFGFGRRPPPPAAERAEDALAARIRAALPNDDIAEPIRRRLAETRERRLPWTATLTPAELLILRSHGLRPVAAISANCWMLFSPRWSADHAEGWRHALRRLWEEARAAGANAVLDVRMRRLGLSREASLDFTLTGTAVAVDGLPPSGNPVIATVPALEFVKLLEADVVPTGIAVGTASGSLPWVESPGGALLNYEQSELSRFWNGLRQRAHAALRRDADGKGNGVLAHSSFGTLEREEGQLRGRHAVVATTVDGRRRAPFRHEIRAVLDMCAGPTPLAGRRRHHEAYADEGNEGAI
jgi:hypothetical protein